MRWKPLKRGPQRCFLRVIITLCLTTFFVAPANAGSRADVLKKLNDSASTKGSDDAKSWRIFFDACLQMTPPPLPVSDLFNMNTVWPGMDGWSEVSIWAEQNEQMAGKRSLNQQSVR